MVVDDARPRLAEDGGNAAEPAGCPAPDADAVAAAAGDEVWVLPASFGQERLWVLDRLTPGSPLFNIPAAYRLAGPLDRAALAAAVAAVVARHEALRTTFLLEDGAPRQAVSPPPADPLRVVDLAAAPAGERAAEADRRAAAEARTPFDLAEGPLFRATLLRLAGDDHRLLLTLHHTVADGWSIGVLERELAAFYAAAAGLPGPPPPPEPPIQYGDYADWQRRTLSAEALAPRVEAWRLRLDGAPPVLELPADRARPAVQSHRGAQVERRLETAAGAADAALARAAGATPFLVHAAAFAVLLHRLTGRRDLVFGTALANREQPELAGLVGFFANTLPLRLAPVGPEPFRRLLARARQAFGEVIADQDLPFDRVVEALRPERDPAHNPILQVMFLLDDGAADDGGGPGLALPGIAVERLPASTGTAKYDLALTVRRRGGRLSVVADYAADLFDPPTVEGWLAAYETLLAAALADPDLPVEALPALDAATRRRLLVEWNATAAPFPRDRCLHHGFLERARQRPEAPAVVAAGGATVSYGGLAARSTALAGHLRRLGVGRGTLVGVHLRRSPRMVEAVLAVEQAGGAYVPLDADWPADRIAWIAQRNGIAHFVAEPSTLGRLDEVAAALPDGTPAPEVVVLDPAGEAAGLPAGTARLRPSAGPAGTATADRPDATQAPPAGPAGGRATASAAAASAAAPPTGRLAVSSPPPADPLAPAPAPDPARDAGADDLAYVIFTSGSTGWPKGVAVRHRAAVNLVEWVNRTFAVGADDRLLFVTALSFDLSVYDVFGTLAAGAAIRLADEDERADPKRLARALADEPITFWDSAPAALQQLVPYLEAQTAARPEAAARAALRLVFLSGDWIPLSLPGAVRRSFPRAEVVSLGGATEATVWSNVHRVGAELDPDWPSIPYGVPIANARYHVLDRRLGPVPVGVPGDLYIGGECLASGYAAAPAQTAAQFLPDPFAAEVGASPGGRLYRTGDRARYRHGGLIEFLGRLDTQVKVRGFRIELGEVEAVLADHPAVAEAVVLAREDTPGNRRLVAYVRPADPAAAPDPGDLALAAAERLPEYMLPVAWVSVERWPLSPTGKLDRKALPAPGAPHRAAAGPVRVSPRRRAEEVILRVWREVLGVARVDPAATFFDLGGTSLTLADVHVRLEKAFERPIAMVDLFRYPTVAELAAELTAGLAEAAEANAAASALAGEEEAAPAAAAPARVRRIEVVGEEAPAAASAAGRAPAASREVAIVGLAGRFPGAANADALWRLLAAGAEAISRFDDDELLAAGVDPAHLAHPRYVKARGALAGADLFDAELFGLSPRQAQILDPQHRLFLECVWEALDDAGRPPSPDGPRIGVFAGANDSGYGRALADDPEIFAAVGRFQIGLANRCDYLPTRVSHLLDLTGPAIDVQTACSTSLVAVHLARLALLNGDCDLAIAGGASVQLHERRGYFYLDGGIDSPDGHTRAFDAAAAGMVAGSGVGVVVLKRLADALADGDTIRAVLRGSAVNNDGGRGKMGFTAPSAEGQETVVRQALADAGVSPATIGYVEAHGTGTPMGDPIEVAALTRAFGDGAPRGGCLLGSIKTNLGHLDAAAGVAGLIKAVLALEHRQVPPSLHFERPNPAIDFAGSPFRIATELTDWAPAGGMPRRAGVSSFGIGGTNAHVVLEEAPGAAETGGDDAPDGAAWTGGADDPAAREGERTPEDEGRRGLVRPAQLLVVSARTPAALERACRALAERLEAAAERAHGGPGASTSSSVPEGSAAWLADAAHTLSRGRRAFPWRQSVVCRDPAAGAAALRRLRPPAAPASAASPPVAFLFPGQGAQHPGMAAEVYAEEPVFRRAVDEAAEALAPALGFDLRDVLFPPPGDEEKAAERLGDTAVTQPALFVVEHALARLWMDWGVEPAAMVGHSLGEVVAACLAGVFSLDDALALVAERGRLMAAQPPGAMLAVPRGEEEVARLLAGQPELALAAVNAPGSAVVAGPAAAVERLTARLAEDGVETRRLVTSHAFHSPMMEPAVAPFAARVAAVGPRAPRRPFVSNLTGTWIRDEEATDPAYWAAHLRRTVRFADGAATLLAADGFAEGGGVLVEVGPGRTLSRLVRQQPGRRRETPVVPSLPPPRGAGADLDALLAAAGALWGAGVELDGSAFWRGRRARRVPLPAYPFERRRFWVDGFEAAPAAAGEATAAAEDAAPRGEAEEAVAAVWRDLLGVEAIGRHDDFFDVGGSSLAGVQLAVRLAERFAVELPAGFLLETSSVADLAARLTAGAVEGAAPAPSSCLVKLTRAAGEGGRRPLFLVHQVGGHVYTFRELSRALGPAQPLYALRSRGLEPGEEPFATIEEMAVHYVALVRAEQPRGPYWLGGASMGGMVAFEMAHQLAAAGERVDLLPLFDTPCLDQMPRREDNVDPVWLVVRDRTGLDLDAAAWAGRPVDERFDLALEAVRAAGAADRLDEGEARRLARVIEANIEALYTYRPRPLDGRVLFFRAAERRRVDPPRPELPWIELALGGAETVVVPGDHESMHQAPHVETMARHLGERLEAARRAPVGRRG